jgi:cytochrome c oxidase subunit 4
MSDHAAVNPHGGDPIEHHDDHAHAHGPVNTPEAIAREKKLYLTIFGALATLTVITVLISRVHFDRPLAIFIALFIATIKATLVAGFFMHLLHERKFIFGVLGLTLFFFGMLLWGPWHHHHEVVGDYGVHGATDVTTSSTAPAEHEGASEHGAAPAHNSGH